ncbi:MAG: hypothetical protein QNK11_00975 [Legionella sp.]|nr:hypothetical protein [Legionella sp.]
MHGAFRTFGFFSRNFVGKQFLREHVGKCPEVFSEAAYYHKEDKKLVGELTAINSNILRYVPHTLLSDLPYAKKLVGLNSRAFQHLPEESKADPGVIDAMKERCVIEQKNKSDTPDETRPFMPVS